MLPPLAISVLLQHHQPFLTKLGMALPLIINLSVLLAPTVSIMSIELIVNIINSMDLANWYVVKPLNSLALLLVLRDTYFCYLIILPLLFVLNK